MVEESKRKELNRILNTFTKTLNWKREKTDWCSEHSKADLLKFEKNVLCQCITIRYSIKVLNNELQWDAWLIVHSYTYVTEEVQNIFKDIWIEE